MESVLGAIAEGRTTGWSDGRSSRGRPSRSIIKGREGILEELREFATGGEHPLPTILQGPCGAGTSALAQEYVSMLRSRLNGQNPVIIRVDVSNANRFKGDSTHGVAVSLLQHFSPGEGFQGVSASRIMWWFLRRITVEGRPVIVWLDQVRPNVRSLKVSCGRSWIPACSWRTCKGFLRSSWCCRATVTAGLGRT